MSSNSSLLKPGLRPSRISYRCWLQFGPLTLAVLMAWGASGDESAFGALLAANLWLLGYHHVIATYTRTAMDQRAWKQFWPLSVGLFPLVFACVFGLLKTGGVVLVTTVYVHWQLFHYVRQSEGIAKSLDQNAVSLFSRKVWKGLFYGFPLLAFLTLSAYAGDQFLGMEVWLVRLPEFLLAVLWLAISLLATWVAFELARKRTLYSIKGSAAYVGGHFCVFALSYLAMDSLEKGWLVVSSWHNLQYLLFVGKANRDSVVAGRVSSTGVLAAIARPGRAGLYIAFCLTLTAAIYYSLMNLESWVQTTIGLSALGASALLYQTMNFHHYVVDAIIWRRRRAST